MRIKKEYIILVVIIAALAFYITLHKSNRTHYSLPAVLHITGSDISKIEIKGLNKSILLNKKENNWYIDPQGFPADTDKVNNMLDVIEKLTVTALVSESKSYVRYDLNEDKKIAIKVWAGETPNLEFGIGKTAATYRHTYILLNDDPNVYHVKGDIRHKFDYKIDELRDMTVLSFEQHEIEEAEFIKGKKTAVISRKGIPVEIAAGDQKKETAAPKTETMWQDSGGNKADESIINRLLSSLSRLKCEKYIKDDEKKDDEKKDGRKKELKDPIYTVLLRGAKEYTLSIFAKTDKEAKNYPAISSENDYPFLLSDSQVDNMKTNIDKILNAEKKSETTSE